MESPANRLAALVPNVKCHIVEDDRDGVEQKVPLVAAVVVRSAGNALPEPFVGPHVVVSYNHGVLTVDSVFGWYVYLSVAILMVQGVNDPMAPVFAFLCFGDDSAHVGVGGVFLFGAAGVDATEMD